jgi:hypothetical protein
MFSAADFDALPKFKFSNFYNIAFGVDFGKTFEGLKTGKLFLPMTTGVFN